MRLVASSSSTGVAAGLPKVAIRASLDVGLLSEDDARLAFAMADDRNRTVHTYDEELAARIFRDLDGYAQLLGRWVEGMGGRSQG